MNGNKNKIKKVIFVFLIIIILASGVVWILETKHKAFNLNRENKWGLSEIKTKINSQEKTKTGNMGLDYSRSGSKKVVNLVISATKLTPKKIIIRPNQKVLITNKDVQTYLFHDQGNILGKFKIKPGQTQLLNFNNPISINFTVTNIKTKASYHGFIEVK